MKHLMILRCGKNSIHQSWMHYIQKLMDVALVYFDDSDFSSDNPTYNYHCVGTKLGGIHEYVTKHPDIINQYDYFWLFDDDVHIPYESAKGIVNFINKYEPALSAPSLSLGSHFSHPITLQQPSLFLRGTDFVEVMVPIMSKQFLKDTLKQFLEFPMWGIERYWQHVLWDYNETAFIYDKWPVIHTRPIGTGSIYKLAEKLNINIIQDDAKSIARYGAKFNNTQSAVLFGLTNELIPTFLTTSTLRKHIHINYQIFYEIYDKRAMSILNEVANKTNYPNTLFSQFLSFPKIQKLLSIDNISPKQSNIIVRDWNFGSKTLNTLWCNNMRFDLDGRVNNYYHDNEYYWEFSNDKFIIYSKDRKTSTIFDKKEIIDNNIVMLGKFNNRETTEHYLKESKADF